MTQRLYMPTKVFEGKGCVRSAEEVWASLGKRALIVTGKSSAVKSGALRDVTDTLGGLSVGFEIYDSVCQNPTVENAFEAGRLARKLGADFVVGIGGGSPLDAAKAAAVFGANDIEPMEIYNAPKNAPLPVIAIPTTAGTGSEVTQYSVLTVSGMKTKVTAKGDHMFPKIAFLDSRYIQSMPTQIAVYTALDAMSHCIESVLCKRNSHISEPIALHALEILGENIKKFGKTSTYESADAKLLYAAMLAGVAIAHTGTVIVHSMGYALTWHKKMKHGHANGMLLAPFLKLADKYVPNETAKIYKALKLGGYAAFESFINGLEIQWPIISEDEAEEFSGITIKNENVMQNLWDITQEEEKSMLLWKPKACIN